MVTVCGPAWRMDDPAELVRSLACLEWPPDSSLLFDRAPVRASSARKRKCITGRVLVADAGFESPETSQYAAAVLKRAGVTLVLARGFDPTFYWSAIHLGLPVLGVSFAAEILEGDGLEVDLTIGDVRNITSGWAYCVEPVPRKLRRIIADGGLMPHIRKRRARPRLASLRRPGDGARGGVLQ